MQEVDEEINHRLKCTRKEWRVKSKIVSADEVEADKIEGRIPASAKGKTVASTSVNMVFVLPAELSKHAADEGFSDASAKLTLPPEQAVFDKPEDVQHRHLKPLYIKGFLNGKPISKMLVDGGAAINLMPYTTFRKLGHVSEDLIKTNMVLKDFSGNSSETKWVFKC